MPVFVREVQAFGILSLVKLAKIKLGHAILVWREQQRRPPGHTSLRQLSNPG